MIIIIVNNKGGTGKTTTTVNLSAALAHNGYRVLMIDLDSQSSASVSLGIPWNKLRPSIADVLYQQVPVHEAIRRSIMPGLDIITSDIELANCDLMLSEVVGRENRLKESLDAVTPYYDFVLCDCPPSISLLSVTALVAADQYIIPVTPEYLALEGLISWMNVVKRVEKGIGTANDLMGILLTLVNPGLGDTKKYQSLFGVIIVIKFLTQKY
ncbi:MAG: chromosome partitioning protein [Candidatus Magnetoglobus multicellularis str. Araruama]|uniref:Chromosome partitioning protein n=1 Tax=Candidatus Magnetoglobus multicellularis str. Araruama TaxID=890399 RepID=A0A1V1PGS1_9BACT|nr:MAG: chromosome partitioning protein [Candidatus Magnetoglobus multicellularis str. Araruama]